MDFDGKVAQEFGCFSRGGRGVGSYPRCSCAEWYEGNLPLYIRTASREIWCEGCSTWRRNSDVFAIELVLSGELVFEQFGKVYPVRAGEIYLIQPDADSEIRCERGIAEKIYVSISGPLLNGFLLSGKLAGVSWLKPEKPLFFRDAMQEAITRLTERGEHFQETIAQLAYRLLLELWNQRNSLNYPPDLSRILGHFDRMIAHSISVDKLAADYGLSRAGLFRLFAKYLGTSPMRYLSNRRLELAEELLRNSGLSIKEIADRTGFRRARYFSGEFRRKYHCSPRQYRQNCRSEQSDGGEQSDWKN